MSKSAPVSRKTAVHPDDEIERQVKQATALIRAAERALTRHAKKTRTVFIGRDARAAVKASSGD